MSRPGDWNCRSCQHLNFQRRDTCQRCGDNKSGGGADFGSFGSGGFGNGFGNDFGSLGGRSGGGGGSSFGGFGGGSDVRPGDWYCTSGNCGAHNFASRSSCFKCGSFKDEPLGGALGGLDCDISRLRGFGGATAAMGGGSGGGGGRSGWKSGDWICTRFGCNEHNFANRMECFRCSAPKH